MPYEIIEKLKKQIADFKDEAGFEDIGTVTETGDGIVKIAGLRKCLSQELLTIESEKGEIAALAFNLEEGFIGAVVLGDALAVRVGHRVRQTGKIISIPMGNEMIGRVVDPLGRPVDGKGVVYKDAGKAKDYPLERKAPDVLARESVNVPLHTGIKAIDAMVPIGRGQRELIIGDRATGKTSVALDTILNQQNDPSRPPVICIYVAIGQKNSKIAQFVKVLEETGAIKYTIVVAAPASIPAPLQYLAPYAGAAIGEYFMDQGKDALVIYDDLTKHADAYRQLSLLLRRPPGREAFPGDVFYLHSRLLERAAKMSKEKGGGSLTALPIVETQLGDISGYIPTNVISITDGQIFLESTLFNQGQRPAINVGLSVSRVGSAAQTKAMKKIAGPLRLELAQFRELQAFVQFASDLDEGTKKKIQRGELLTEVLKQADRNPLPFEREVLVLYAAIRGYIDTLPVNRVGAFQVEFLDFIEKLHQDDVLKPLQEKGELTDTVDTALKTALQEFLKGFK